MEPLFQALSSASVIRRWSDLEVLSAVYNGRACVALHASRSTEADGDDKGRERLAELATLHRSIRGTLFPAVVAADADCVVLDCSATLDLGTLWQSARVDRRKVLDYSQAAALGLDIAIALGQLKNVWSRGLGSLCWANLLADTDGGTWLLAIPGVESGWHPDAQVHQAPEVAAGALPTPAADVFAMWALFISCIDVLDLPDRMKQALAKGATDEYSRLFVQSQQAAGASIVTNRLASTAHAVPHWEVLWDALGISPDHGSLRRQMATLMSAYGEKPKGHSPASSVGGGRYELRRAVGVGATGSVWESYDRNLGETVAIKRLRADVGDNAKRRFKREAQLLRKVIHPCVIHGFDYFEEDDIAFAVMRFVDGPQLDAFARGLEPTATRVGEVVADVAAGLAALHATGIVHRDVKPGNVLVEGDGGAVLVDLGVAGSGDLSSFTTSAGSLRFMSPEQRHGLAVSGTSDVYSLGVTWWSALHWARGLEPDWMQFEQGPLAESVVAQLEVSPAHVAFLRACISADEASRPSADALVRGLLEAPSEVSEDDERPALRLGPGVRWLDLPGGQVVSLGRRVVMRRILQALADARLTSAGAISAESLLAAGWPGEQMSEESGMNRLYVTMTRMRKLGLEAVLTTTDDGWTFSKDIRVVCVTEPTAPT